MRGRGEHDDDVPLVTPIVQQAEQAADAADAHMNVVKMEMISRAAAKMTNSAAASELTGDEIWTLGIGIVWSIRVKVRKQVHKLQHRFKSFQ